MLTFIYITNNPQLARIAVNAGVSRIFVDLEVHGKYERQGHLDTVISGHSVDDVFTVIVDDCNEPPVVDNPIDDLILQIDFG